MPLTIKELLKEDFELRIAMTKNERDGFRIYRVAFVVEKEGATFIRWLPLTTTFKLLLINSPEVNSYLPYFKRENKSKFEIKLKGDDRLRRLIEQTI
jgi:hypothetical protein